MSTLALYRKYRPQEFSGILGQDHIVKILKNAIKLGRVSHAYLFSGPRGIGKTSVARILAKEAKCSDIDLLEIDAASSRGIDEIRALRDSVRFSPMEGKIKVYIIDEVHMLTKEAFNALLKTLEEPPSHVIFILATTELEKVPQTIVSRCQSFSFRKIPENILRSSAVDVAKKEGFVIDEEAAGLIALFADGSFRDAQSMLDQVLSLGDKNKDNKITGKEVREFLSVPAREIIEDFLSSLFKKNVEKGMTVIQKAVGQNLDPKVFLKLILRDLRFLLLIRLAPNSKKILEDAMGEREFDFLEKHMDDFNVEELGKILSAFLETYDIRTRPYLPYLPLELALVRVLS